MAAKKKHKTSPGANGLEGRYANYFKIGYNAFEFVLDFGQLYNGREKPELHTRIITSPGYAKHLAQSLQEAMEGYEGRFLRSAHDSGDKKGD